METASVTSTDVWLLQYQDPIVQLHPQLPLKDIFLVAFWSHIPQVLRPQHPCQDDYDLSTQPQGLPKWAQHESKNIIQGQPTVPWIKRPSCWPNSCLDQKIQM